MSRDDLIEIAATYITETPNAYLLDFGDSKHWVPKSLCKEEEKGSYLIPEWKLVDMEVV